MPIVSLASAWLIGLTVGLNFTIPLPLVLASLVPPILLIVFKQKKRPALLLAASLLVFFGGSLQAANSLKVRTIDQLEALAGPRKVALAGAVVSEPEISGKSQKIRFKAQRTNTEEGSVPISGTTLVIAGRYPSYHYGDSISITGTIAARPANARGTESKYWDYLAESEIRCVVFYPRIELQARGGGFPALQWLYRTRNYLASRVEGVIPEPQAAVAEGITFGLRTNIPADVEADFARTGTTHLLAVSGMNLTIIAGILLAVLLSVLGRRYFIYVWISLLAVWIYAWLTGLQPPVVRAAVMASFFLMAELFGRQRSGVVALLLAATLMAGIEPDLIRNPSFQLSFAAMAGLVFVSPKLEAAFGAIGDRYVSNPTLNGLVHRASSAIAVSVAAVIATWPLTTYYFGTFSPLGPLVTIVTVPVMPAIMVTTLATCALGVFAPLAHVAGWLAWLPLSYLITVINAFGSISFASFQNIAFPTPVIAVYFAAMILVLLAVHFRSSLRKILVSTAARFSGFPLKWSAIPLATVACLIWAANLTLPDSRLHVDFLDVGQGDAILIKRGNAEVLVDGGPDPQLLLNALGKKMPFWDRSIDAIVLTHPDSDHLTGLIEVLRRYSVGRIVASNSTSDSPVFAEWQSTIKRLGLSTVQAESGVGISMGDGVSLAVINPLQSDAIPGASDTNLDSVVIRASLGKVSFLLTGDLPDSAERRLIIERANLRSTVLKAGHHGSSGSTSQEFLAVVDPAIVVVSVGTGNAYGQPSAEVIDRITGLGRDIFRTDEQGTIEFITDGQRLWAKSDR